MRVARRELRLSTLRRLLAVMALAIFAMTALEHARFTPSAPSFVPAARRTANATLPYTRSTTPAPAVTLLVCIIAARRTTESYVPRVMGSLERQITPAVRGVLVDLDASYADAPLPSRFDRWYPAGRVKETCDEREGDIGRPNCVARQQTRFSAAFPKAT